MAVGKGSLERLSEAVREEQTEREGAEEKRQETGVRKKTVRKAAPGDGSGQQPKRRGRKPAAAKTEKKEEPTAENEEQAEASGNASGDVAHKQEEGKEKRDRSGISCELPVYLL